MNQIYKNLEKKKVDKFIRRVDNGTFHILVWYKCQKVKRIYIKSMKEWLRWEMSKKKKKRILEEFSSSSSSIAVDNAIRMLTIALVHRCYLFQTPNTNGSIIASRCQHMRICRIPTNTVHCPRMSRQCHY